MSRVTSQQVKKNISYSIIAQIIYIIVSFVSNLVLPKYLDEYQFAYWQSYLLYAGYVGILHFGLLDGILLRYAQYDYNELDRPTIHSQFTFLLLITTIAMVITIVLGQGLADSALKKVIPFVAMGIVIRNAFHYTSYSFQMTYRIREYGYLIVLSRIIFCVAIVLFVALGCNDFKFYACSELGSELFAVLLCLRWNSDMYLGRCLPLGKMAREVWTNVSCGISLMIANWLSFLLTGLGRIFVERHWDVLIFGKISFAFSLIAMFLVFITAVSVVVFPSLKRIDPERLSGLYMSIRNILSPIFVFVLLLYYPCCLIIKWWLPNYVSSIEALGILFPIVIFSSKVGLLTNNYLKALRGEKAIFKINLITFVVSVLLYTVSTFLLDNLTLVLVSMVITIALCSVMAEQVVARKLGLNITKEQVGELVLSSLFILIVGVCSPLLGFLLFGVVAMIYYATHAGKIKQSLSALNIKIKK